MKFYAIAYEQIYGKFHFYGYPCKFFSERTQIEESFYEEVKPCFPLAHKNNKELSGMYFPEGL